MEIEKIGFRFIRPLWYKREGMIITCLEPVFCSRDADVCADTILSFGNSATNAYKLGFVDAEKHVLADLLVHQDDFEMSYYAKARQQLQDNDACPRFIAEAPEEITFDEKVVALAAYNYSLQRRDDDLGDFVTSVYALYFVLLSLATEEEEDPWNYSPERETVDFSSTDLHGSRWTPEEAMQKYRQLGDGLRAEKACGFEQLPRGSTCPRHGWIDGRHYVLKCGSFSEHSSDGHVHNECVADALLRTAGCLVPESWELQSDIGNGKIETLRLSRFIEKGSDLRPALDNGSTEQRQKLIAQIVDTYPVIAFIDGTDSYQHYALDNVLVDEDYNLWYIDNGASFDYRARGLLKDWYWKRFDPQDGKHGFYAVWDYASDSFKTIVQSVSKSDLRKSAARYDFVALAKSLPADYQRKELLDYAEALNNWARQMPAKNSEVQDVNTDRRNININGGIMTKEDCEWLEAVSLRIAKMVRRIDKFIDEGKIGRTATSGTAKKYAAEVDVARLQRLAAQDVSGRVDRLLDVCDDIANSAAAGYTVKVLADKWDRYADSTQRPKKKGNVDFSEYAFTRTGYEATGGSVTMPGRPVRPTRPRKAQANQQLNIEVVCGNVEEIEADVVVNAANEGLRAGSGICGAIFRRAGYVQLQAACDKVAPCPTGEARITPAFGITNARYIIHAVGPVWYGGTRGEPQLLANCYRNLFKVAVENGCKSVAVPSISTGIFGYPLDEAIEIAVREAKTFVSDHPDVKVIFVAWAGGTDGGKGIQAKYLKVIDDRDDQARRKTR